MGHRKKSHHDEKQKQLEQVSTNQENLINKPRKLVTMIMSVWAKKGNLWYKEVPIWKLLLFILSIFLAVILLFTYQSLEGYNLFFVTLIIAALGLVTCIMILLRKRLKDMKYKISAMILGIVCFLATVIYMLDIPYLSNPVTIQLSCASVQKSPSTITSIGTAYMLIGYTNEGAKITFSLTKKQSDGISSNLLVDYLPNSNIIVNIKKY